MTGATKKFLDVGVYTADVVRRLDEDDPARRRLRSNPQLDDFDYGVWWRDRQGGIYRLSWQDDTDELYLVRLSGPHVSTFSGVTEDDHGMVMSAGGASGMVEVLAMIPAHEDGNRPRPDRSGGPPPYRDDTVEKILEGWPDHCDQPSGIDWLNERVEWAVERGLARYP